MSEYKPGDTVLYGGDTPCTFEYGPYRSNPNGKEYALVKFENGYCDTVSLESLRPAPREPEWEYGADSIAGGAGTAWSDDINRYAHTCYRRQKGKPETIEFISPEQVEELRNECN